MGIGKSWESKFIDICRISDFYFVWCGINSTLGFNLYEFSGDKFLECLGVSINELGYWSCGTTISGVQIYNWSSSVFSDDT